MSFDASVLQRVGARYSKVCHVWKGETVAIMGGGPSLDSTQVETLRMAHADGRIKCVAINDAYLLAPWADLMYACDAKWHAWHKNGIAKPRIGLSAADVRDRYAAFKGPRCSVQQCDEKSLPDNVHVLRNRDFPQHGKGISLDPEFIVTGRNSGHQALNVAILAGATTILLCGIDGGGKHWHGGHPDPTPEAFWGEMRRAFSASENEIIAAGVTVINCSPSSSIDSFPKMPLEQALALEAA